MADLYSEGPIYSDAGFSKGPKSTYYGLNDQDLPASVLNVPQTDVDDEWGRTQRIADERTLDYIARIYMTLFDPYGTICGIVLEPGTEGSRINVAKNMINLIGRPGLEEGVFDLDIPSLTLGNIIINGSDNKIYNGSSSEISASSLKLADNLELYSSSSDEGRLRFKTANYLRFYNNDSAAPYTELIVNGKSYRFTEDTLTLPSGGTLTASSLTMGGTLNSRDIIPISNDTYALGSSSYKYSNIYATGGNFSGTITTQGIVPASNDTYALGSSSYRYSNVYSVLGNFDESVFADSFRSQSFGDPSGPVTISGTSISIFDQSSGRSLTFDSDKLNPDLNGTISLGSSSYRYSNVYGVLGNFDESVFADSFRSQSFGDPSGPVTISGTSISIFDQSNGRRLTFDNNKLNPDITGTISLGETTLRYEYIYGTIVNAESVVSANLGGAGAAITICGDSITLWDLDADKYLYFKDDEFRPSTNDHVGLGTSSLRFKNVYSVLGNFEESVRADTVLCQNFGDYSGTVKLFGSPVTLWHQSSGRNLNFDGTSFSPDTAGDIALGSSSYPFKEIWLWDGYTSSSVRVRVCNGVLEPI